MFIDYSNPNKVVITHKGEKYTGNLHPNNFLAIAEKGNDYVFEILSINDPKEFISNIVGYIPADGTFPELMYKKDLIKVLDALNEEYDKQFGSTYGFLRPEDLKEGDYIYIEDSANGFKAIYIFKSFEDNLIKRYVYYNLNSAVINISTTGCRVYTNTIKIRKANTTERELLDNSLYVRENLFWNSVTKKLEEVKGTYKSSEVCSVSDIGYTDLRVDVGGYSFDQLAPIAVKESSWNQLREASKAIESPTIAEPTININDFIKEKKHYQLNFNN